MAVWGAVDGGAGPDDWRSLQEIGGRKVVSPDTSRTRA